MDNNCELCNGFDAMMKLYNSGMDMDEAFHIVVDSMLEDEADALSQDLYDLGYKHGIADINEIISSYHNSIDKNE